MFIEGHKFISFQLLSVTLFKLSLTDSLIVQSASLRYSEKKKALFHGHVFLLLNFEDLKVSAT